jgi:hypothetical protein
MMTNCAFGESNVYGLSLLRGCANSSVVGLFQCKYSYNSEKTT